MKPLVITPGVDLEHVHETERQNYFMQSDLIRIAWGYHADGLRNGHPVAIGNSPFAEDTGRGDRPSPLNLAKDIRKNGLSEFNLEKELRSNPGTSPTSQIAHAVSMSIWDSLNHLSKRDIKTADKKHADFLKDPAILELHEKLEAQSLGVSRYMGASTIYSGVHVGVGKICFFLSIKYGLPEDSPYNVPRIAKVLSKGFGDQLSMLGMNNAAFLMIGNNEGFERLHDPESKIGIPVSTVQRFTHPQALGCPSRLKTGELSEAVLRKHGIYEQTYGEKAHPSTIEKIAESTRAYFNDQVQTLLNSLTSEEQTTLIPPVELKLLKGEFVKDAH